MSQCPKCGYKLKLTDIKQTCPECGVNLMYYGFEDRFYSDAKYAEMGFAKARIVVARLKASFIGSKFQIIRVCMFLLPVCALLIPFGNIGVSLPLFEKNVGIGIIGLIQSFTDGTFSAVSSNGASVILGEESAVLFRVFCALTGALVAALLILLGTLLLFTGYKRTAVFVCISCVMGTDCSVYVMLGVSSLVRGASGFVTASSGFGGFAVIAAFAAVFTMYAAVAKNGIKTVYREGDEYRAEIAKKLKRGEIKFEDIPQPIFETGEERIKREEAIKKTVDGAAQKAHKEDGGSDE